MRVRKAAEINPQTHIPFLNQRVIYNIFAQHTRLPDLVSLARTSRRANQGNEVFADQSWCYLNLRGVKLSWLDDGQRRSRLTAINLNYASLKFASMRNMMMEMVSFYGADLTGADLTDSFLVSVDFRFANLEGAIFRRTDAFGCFFNGLILDGAKVTGARFFNEDLRVLQHNIEFVLYAFPRLNDTIRRSPQVVVNFKVLLPAVLQDLIFTVNAYHNSHLDSYQLKTLKTSILIKAQQHSFFCEHESKSKRFFDYVLRINPNKNSFFTPAQRTIQNEIERIENEYTNLAMIKR